MDPAVCAQVFFAVRSTWSAANVCRSNNERDTDAVTGKVASGVTGSRTGVDGWIGID